MADHAFVGPVGEPCLRCGLVHGSVNEEDCPVYAPEHRPHQWTPIAEDEGGGHWEPEGVRLTAQAGPESVYVILVLEACPNCRQYRTAEYWPVPRD